MVNDIMYKISVIIPVYNAENTLKQAVNSVINQSIGFENIELILVDDNSNDDSKRIIQDYADKYDNVKAIFLKENTGSPSIPRNTGIDNATAPYLMFLDSDDEYFKNYCEVLYDAIDENNVDIVQSNHSSKLNDDIYIPDSIRNITFEKSFLEDKNKLFLKLVSWGNIYNTSLIKENEVKFPLTLHEDGVFHLNCLLLTNNPVIYLPNYPGYIYSIDDEDSISHKVNLNVFNKFLDGYALCGNLVKEHINGGNKDIEIKLFTSFVNMAIFILIKLDDLDEGVNVLYNFENSLEFDITLSSKPLNLVNGKIMNKQFMQAKILLKLMGLIYNNKLIKNYIFIKYSNLKILD